jgi:ribosomal-protein-alanine N-acetyltransferase
MPIRLATLRDVPQLLALARDSATAAHWTAPQYETALTGNSPRRLVLVVESGRVVGFAVAAELVGEWELENIVVADSQRRKGVGSALLKSMLQQVAARHGERVFLEVRESNLSARAFYDRLGFSVSGRRPRYYHNPPEDAILYVKNLKISAPEIG